MLRLLGLLLALWLVLTVVGAVVEGLFWLAVLGGALVVATALVGRGAAHFLGDERLLSDDAKRVMQRLESVVTAYGTEIGRDGVGMALTTVGDRQLVGHSGGYPGHITLTLIYPVDRLVVRVLTNAVDGPAEELATGLVKLVDVAELGGRLVLVRPTAADPLPQVEELEVVDDATLRVAAPPGFGAPGRSRASSGAAARWPAPPPPEESRERPGAPRTRRRSGRDRGVVDEGRRTPDLPGSTRSPLRAVLAGALATVAWATLLLVGDGWAWGSPVAELRWYATGLGSEATLLQLLGNLALLAVPTALVVLLRPSLGRPPRLAVLALAGGSAIELLQWALPLGRVVSPVDALLNATGALLAGLLVDRAVRRRPEGHPGPVPAERMRAATR